MPAQRTYLIATFIVLAIMVTLPLMNQDKLFARITTLVSRNASLSIYTILGQHQNSSNVENTLIANTKPVHNDNNTQSVCVSERHFQKYLLSEFKGNQTCEPPQGDLDLPRHVINSPVFACDLDPPKPVASDARATTYRHQLEITCNERLTEATGKLVKVNLTQQLQVFTTAMEKACLHQYILQHCYDNRPVPDVIHLVWYGNPQVNFRHTLGLYSIFTNAKPRLVILHGDVHPNGTLWDAILPAAYNLVRVYQKPQTHVGGKKIEHVENKADLGRIHVLLEYGGIYLDTDMVIIRKLDIFRDVQFAANIEGSYQQVANGIMFSVAGHPLLKFWLHLWNEYDGHSLNSHSVELLTTLAKQYPYLISRLGPIFIKFGYFDMKQFYKQTCSLQESYAAHLYRAYYPNHSDVTSVKRENSTFTRLARFVLFGDPELC